MKIKELLKHKEALACIIIVALMVLVWCYITKQYDRLKLVGKIWAIAGYDGILKDFGYNNKLLMLPEFFKTLWSANYQIILIDDMTYDDMLLIIMVCTVMPYLVEVIRVYKGKVVL